MSPWQELHSSQEEFLCSEIVKSIMKYSVLKCPAEYSHYLQDAEWDWQRMTLENFGALQDCLKKMV